MTTATPTQAQATTADMAMEFAFQVVGDLGAAFAMAHVHLGDRLGLFKTLAGGPATVESLAAKTGLQERYLREWASAMTASQYIDYDPETKQFSLPPHKAAVLADDDSPVFVVGGAQMMPDHYAVLPGIEKAFRDGGGVPYSEFTEHTIKGTERFFRPGYLNFLVQEWIPATGFEQRLKDGAKVADVGCGRGVAIATLAAAYPASRFYGFDNHAGAIDGARENAKQQGVTRNATFEVVASTELPQSGDFDLVSTLDSLHDMVDPHGAARSIYGALKPDGGWFIIEPNVSARLEENINPVGRVFYSVSGLQCMPVSLAHGGAGYGACMGPDNIRKVVEDAGFRSLERLPVENPFNALYIARK
jgi:2-polyprenyl-3-methyl-5-hydroxy-6-metoxy-1,4-benzoquinol methylase